MQYDYYSDQATCLTVLMLLGLSYKCLLLLSLRLSGLWERRAVLQRVNGARRRARRLIKAGLRWRDQYAAPGADVNGSGIVEHNGIGIEEEDAVSVEFGNAFHTYNKH